MILNLSILYSDIEEAARHFNLNLQDELILDCSTFIKLDQPNFYSVCELKDFEQINDLAAKQYIQEIGKVSIATNTNQSLRSVKVLDYVLFWYSHLAIKRPDLSLGKTIYLLDAILPSVIEKFGDQQVFVSLPGNSKHFRGIIERVLKKHGLQKFIIIKKKKFLLMNLLKSSGKLFLFYFRTYFLFHSNKHVKINPVNHNYFITYTLKKLDNNYGDFFLDDIKKFSDPITQTEYWPVFGSFTALKQSNSFLSGSYKEAFPTIIQLWRLWADTLSQVLTFKWEGAQKNDIFFDNQSLLEAEIKNSAVENMHFFFYGMWLKNYFSKVEVSTNVLYQDEFYESGRVISKSLEDLPRVTTIGIQHGLFDLHHTVYGISGYELDPDAGSPLPAPDIFAVWGIYFKNYFISNNNYNQSRLRILGNPKYFKLGRVPVSNQKSKRILWCTTTPEITKGEITILENSILNKADYKITLREHPFFKYIAEFREEFRLFERFPALKVSDKLSIKQEMEQHDIVIVDCYTTAFFDAYLNGKYCLRFFPYKSSPAYLKNYSSQMLFNVYSEEDVLLALNTIESFDGSISLENEAISIMNFNVSDWVDILTNSYSKN